MSCFLTRAFLPALLFFTLSPVGVATAADGAQPAFTSAADAGPDYTVQGEYLGELKTDGAPLKVGIQVIALGDGKFDAEAHPGGLPGDGWSHPARRLHLSGETKNGVTALTGDGPSATLAGGVMTVTSVDGVKIGTLKRVERKSPTLGAKPPAGAVVLFDGASVDKWNGGRLIDGGLLAPGCTSKDSFRDFQLHIEFQTPFMPAARPGPGQ